MKKQLQHNQILYDYNKEQYELLHKESELIFKDPIKSALKLARDLEQHLDFNDNWITRAPGAVHETLYYCVQLLRTLTHNGQKE